jgi:hypothetical protein
MGTDLKLCKCILPIQNSQKVEGMTKDGDMMGDGIWSEELVRKDKHSKCGWFSSKGYFGKIIEQKKVMSLQNVTIIIGITPAKIKQVMTP